MPVGWDHENRVDRDVRNVMCSTVVYTLGAWVLYNACVHKSQRDQESQAELYMCVCVRSSIIEVCYRSRGAYICQSLGDTAKDRDKAKTKTRRLLLMLIDTTS